MLMPMPMVQVRIVRVLMPHRLVLVPVRMGFSYWTVVSVLMMFVMDMTMPM